MVLIQNQNGKFNSLNMFSGLWHIFAISQIVNHLMIPSFNPNQLVRGTL